MDEFPQNTKLYAMMSTNATESLAEAVTNEKMSRNKIELTEKEKADEEYEEYQKQQKDFYKDRDLDFVKNDTSRTKDDQSDSIFDINPFEHQPSDNRLDDDLEDETFPDEFDTNFGGGMESMFAETGKSQGEKEHHPDHVNKNKDALSSFFNI
jgi:hypothetical protein